MKILLTLTAGANSSVTIQDPDPVEGPLNKYLAAGATETVYTTEAQYNHLKAQLDAMVSSGALASYTVKDTEEERSQKWLELYAMAPPSAKALYGKFFVGDGTGGTVAGKPYFIQPDGTMLNLGMTGSDPIIFKGSISIPANFPTAAAVQTGWMYKITADVTDSDVTKTHTLQTFQARSEIAWNGTNWSILDVESEIQEVHAAGAFTLPAGSSQTFVDTATAGAGTSCVLPAGSATNFGDIVVVGDYKGSAAANPITIGRTGGDKIDNVAADYVVNKAYLVVALQSMGTAGWKTIWKNTPVASAAVPQAVGTAAAGTSKVPAPDDHVHGVGTHELLDTDLTAAGTLISASAASTRATVAAGTTGQVLRATTGAAPSFVANYGLEHFDSRQGAPTTETLRVFRALAAGSLVRVGADCRVAPTGASTETMNFDVQKNGVTMLNATILIDQATVAGTLVPGVLAAGAGLVDFVAGDIITVVRTYFVGTGGALLDTCVDLDVIRV